MPKAIGSGSAYYQPSLSSNQPVNQYTRAQQKPWMSSQGSLAAPIGASIVAAGFIPTSTGRVWDKYVNALRIAEEMSPATILRTFQLSALTSQFETLSKQSVSLTPDLFLHHKQYAEYLSRVIGPVGSTGTIADTYMRITKEGLTLNQGQLFFGRSGDLALKHAARITAPVNAGMHLGLGYAQGVNANLQSAKALPVLNDVRTQIIGGQTYRQHVGRQLGAIGTEAVGRFNRLLAAPFELEPFRSFFGKLEPTIQRFAGPHAFAVRPGTGLQMLGRLTAKYGLGLGSIYLGYELIDHMFRESSILDKTIFGEGLTVGGATLWAQSNIASATIADATGLQNYKQLQEDVAPGSTSVGRLLGFPLTGALVASTSGYFGKLYQMTKLQREGMTAIAARGAVEEGFEAFAKGTNPIATLGRNLTTKQGTHYASEGILGKFLRTVATSSKEDDRLTFKLLGKIGPIKMLGTLGAAAGFAATIPFLPGALIPDKSAEELKAIYSGEQEVAIRKGRWWEFGKCLIKSNTYTLSDGRIKTSDEIKIGDRLIGSDHDVAKVINIYTRQHTGEIRKYYTAHDRDIFTGLTNNHIVPVYRNGSLQEVESKEIKLNDYVKVPVFKLEHKADLLDVVNTISSPIVVDNNRVFAAQTNWFNKKIQKSGKWSIPTKIDLDYDLGLLFGYFLAEGNIGFKKENPALIETVHAKSEYNYVLDIERIVAEKFGIQITKRFKTTGKKTKEGCWIVRICSAVLAKLFRDLFYQEIYKSEEKYIPLIALEANKDFQIGLIEGYWRGDGHIDGKSKVITSARKWLLETIQLIALDHGLACGISPHSKGVFNAWRLRFYDQNASNPGSKFIDGQLYSRIRKIEIEDYDDVVYDFEVDHPDHLLQAGTFLVHNSPYEGQNIQYYRPHWYARMQQRSKEKAIWGEDEPNPLTKWLTQEFTYDLERKHYADRPYPITALPFEDVPFVGPLLANTIGRIIKPPRLMHTEEWVNDQGILAESPGFGQRVATELGEQSHGMPISPYKPTQVIGEQAYRMTEMMGLPGFALTSIKQSLTGTPDLFDQVRQLESSRRMFGYEREYWDKELGGMLGMNEAFRRLFPHRRRQIPLYNPIRNTMPCLLPETEVLMSNGFLKQADQVIIGDILVGQNGQDVVVKNVDQFPCDTIVEIKLYGDNYHTNKFSPNHPILTNDHSFVDAINIKKNTYIAFPRRRYFNHMYTMPEDIFSSIELKQSQITAEWIYYGSQSNTGHLHEIAEKSNYDITKIDLKIKQQHPKLYDVCKYQKQSEHLVQYKRIKRFWDLHDFYYLLGVFAAEGSQNNKGKSIKLAGHQNDKWEEKICFILDKYGVKYSKQKAKTGIGQNIIITCPPLLKLLQTFCPGTAIDKHFISTIIDQKVVSKSNIKHLLQGLIDGDGYYCKTTRKDSSNYGVKCGLRTVSSRLAYQFRNLIIDCLGIVPSITYGKNQNHHAFHIACSGLLANQLASFLDYSIIEYAPKQNNEKQYHSPTHVYIKVRDVVITKKDCYVIGHHVDDDATFCTALIATHNTWLPGAGEKGPDLLHGDPFTQVKEGEIRLPGAGYAARFPELEGIAPEDYPLIHRFKILADVAPYTEKFQKTLGAVRRQSSFNELTEYEENIYNTTMEQLKNRKQRKTFEEYEYLTPTGGLFGESSRYGQDTSSNTLQAINSMYANRSEGEKPSLAKKLFGGYWELLSHNAESVMDQMTPIAPAAKLIHQRSAVEDYERTQLFGTSNAFWNQPWRDFIKPTITTALASTGYRDIPSSVQQRRDIEEYFDALKYTKYARLANLAKASKDKGAALEFERKKDETLIGVNPFSRNYSSIFRALPRRERDYFSEFEKASSSEERANILSMVPKNEQQLYLARWKLMLADDIRRANKAGILDQAAQEEGQAITQSIYEEANSEGLPKTEELQAEYIKTRLDGENYADWYRRKFLLPQYNMPGPDWVGFHPSVDLEDIKLKFIQQLGEDMHEYNLWPSRAQQLINKPFIDEEAIAAINIEKNFDRKNLENNIDDLFMINGAYPNAFFESTWRPNTTDSLILKIEQDVDIDNLLRDIF